MFSHRKGRKFYTLCSFHYLDDEILLSIELYEFKENHSKKMKPNNGTSTKCLTKTKTMFLALNIWKVQHEKCTKWNDSTQYQRY